MKELKCFNCIWCILPNSQSRDNLTCDGDLQKIDNRFPLSIISDLNRYYDEGIGEVKVAGIRVYTKSKRYLVMESDEFRCKNCGIEGVYAKLISSHHNKIKTTRAHFVAVTEKDGKEGMLTKDHIIPKSRGGSNDLDNLECLCDVCNGTKGNKVYNKKVDQTKNQVYNDITPPTKP